MNAGALAGLTLLRAGAMLLAARGRAQVA